MSAPGGQGTGTSEQRRKVWCYEELYQIIWNKHTKTERPTWNTYKIDVCVMAWGLLKANVQDDEDRVYEIAGEADIGKRNPESQG